MNHRKTKFYIIISLFVFFALFIFFFPFETKNAEVEFFEEVTNIRLPSTFDIEYSFDSGEYFILIYFTGKSEEITAFSRQNNLDSANQYNSSSMIGWKGLFGKFAAPDSLFTKSYFISRSKGKHDWRILVNPSSGRGWIEIMYPDWGGH